MDEKEQRVRARRQLTALWRRGVEFLGSEYALLGGAMSWVSEHNLVSVISNAGGFGVIAGGSMQPAMLEQEIAKTQALTTKPFGVNLITMHPRLDSLIQVCLESGVSHIVLAGGIPSAAAVKAVKDGGAKLLAFAPALVLAKRLIRLGVDALITEGSEAGGHVGPVSLTVLAQEILPEIKDVPVFVAGGLGRGEAIVSYLEQGAAGAQLGTLFAASKESIAHEHFKQLFLRSSARDAVTTVQVDERFPVIPVRCIANENLRQFVTFQKKVLDQFQKGELQKEEAQLEIEHYWAGALRRAVIEGDVENGSVMAGQSVGMVKEMLPVADIINALVDQAVRALERQFLHVLEIDKG
ncbi:NAD(P)H-dependent flavin oxidoreductase [Entomobacter blattae]|uniref:Nitronate monooxygenase n=1 Tax=Entomobacter blattae TaxID=2762277 RepID=A0A7H1NTM4_9PROT|nr:nitronate monooxygenase [Entomobacter blattae]QNT79134.1 Nitronate monooxygenase [Entomobacter blattae]